MAPISDQPLPETLGAFIKSSFGIAVDTAARVVGEGDECEIWRLDTAKRQLALRVSPPYRSAAAFARIHELMAFVSGVMREVRPPLSTLSGDTVAKLDGSPATLFPWIDGVRVPENDEALALAAARLLADLHNHVLRWPDPATLGPCPAPRVGVETDLADPDLDRQIAEIQASETRLRGPIHGDYYPRNLICSEGRITGIIDWDECRNDLLAHEVAWAVWEFAQDEHEPDLDLARAGRWLAAYRQAGGPLPAREFSAFVPLIRQRMRDEVDATLAQGAALPADDQEYIDRERAAFQLLREREIDWEAISLQGV